MTELRICAEAGHPNCLYWIPSTHGKLAKFCSDKCRKRRWRRTNPEKSHANDQRNREANREKRRDHTRQWTKANPEKNREKVRRWQEANPEKAREKRTRRRYKQFGLDPGDLIPPEAYQTKLDYYNDRCAYCGIELEETGCEWEHVIPISRFGPHMLANLKPSCPSCNGSKLAKLPWEWMPERFSAPKSPAAVAIRAEKDAIRDAERKQR